ncbi:MAG TPA: T9SS type A sorting domain-containing protein [Bacteroidota bacterium]|nr:T9SS type A sorting domain-containing protein [Bacteroidota bacterium]
MKKLIQIFMVLVALGLSAHAQTFSDNFTGLTTGTNLAGQSSWTKGGSGPELQVANATPLTYPGYTSGGGEYAVIPTGTTTSARVYKTFTTPVTSLAHTTFYYSVLLRLTSAGASSNGYFMSLGNSGTGTQYGAKLFARSSGTGFNIGVSKTSNTATYGASVLNFNTTYLVVVRYSFNKPGSGVDSLADDEAYLWVNPIASTEPTIATAECAIASGTGGTDFDGFSPSPVPYNVGNFVWHTRNATNPTGAFDGVRVGYGATSADAWTDLNPGLAKVFDDPSALTVKNADGAITLDGKLDESDWNGAPTLIFGNGAFLKKQAGENTVTGGVDVKASFDVGGVKYSVPNTDSSIARVKFLRKGTDLYIGITSNDKSICKFDWEGDGIFLMIKNSAGVTKEYKLYYQNPNDTIRYEESVLNSGVGAGYLFTGSKVNDTTQVDAGYSAELRVKLASLGFDANTSAVQVALNIFDPDGFQHPMAPWDSARGSYYKSWWGSEWGSSMRTLNLTKEVVKFNDPASLKAKNADGAITLDGKLDEADWKDAPTLLFGNGAQLKRTGSELTATGEVDVKSSFDVGGVKYSVPNTDSSMTRVKFLRKGTDLYIGLTSNDKSICKFDWEGDGIFLQIKNSAGVTKEYKLYYQNLNDTIRYEESVLNSGAGAGFLFAGSKVNDTTSADNGYSAELRVKLASLGYTSSVSSVDLSMAIFDPDGFQHPMAPWDSARGSFYKSWWGSEWGSSFRKITFDPEIKKFDDPQELTAKNATGTITLDGKLDEADWNGAPTLLFGNGAQLKRTGSELTVTGEADVKSSFDVGGVKYSVPNTDSSLTRVKFLRKGTDLYIGITSNDKSICKFDWEGDGLFLQIKDAANVTKEYKLYYQNLNDTIRYEESVLNSGAGAGYLFAGSKVNDTTQVDAGYSAELRVKLASLGYTASVPSVQLSMNIFDPDGFQHPMAPWDSARGSYYKSWWGSEWGNAFRTVKFAAPFDNPDTIATALAASVTLDGKLTEPEWASAPTLVFGPSNAPKTGTEKTVTDGVDVKALFDVGGVKYSVPYKDTSYARVKFLQKGMNLYIGITSNDKSICKFDWEGDGMFLMIKNAAGVSKQYKLYYQNLNDTIRYEEDILNSGAGAGYLFPGSKVNDTTQVDAGYSAELQVKLASLGFDATVKSLQVALNVFDPDGFQHPMAPWDSARGSYYKSWWGSEWGSAFKTIKLQTITSVENNSVIPTVYSLSQNYPNPFNPSTMVKFSVPQTSVVEIKVYDLIGREVSTLANGTYTAGYYTLQFNAERLATGVYVYRMTSTPVAGNASTFVETKKLMLLK